MQTDSQLNDAEIIHQILDGDVDAFELLMTRYGDYVLNIARKHVPQGEIEEIAQDVFIRVFRSLPSYRGESEFKYWLSAISRRACADYWRKAYKSKEIPLSTLNERHRNWLENTITDESDQTFQSAGSRQEARELLDWALSQLPPEDRMVLELVHLEGLSGKEAARQLGWSVSNVKVRAHRSRKKMKKMLSRMISE